MSTEKPQELARNTEENRQHIAEVLERNGFPVQFVEPLSDGEYDPKNLDPNFLRLVPEKWQPLFQKQYAVLVNFLDSWIIYDGLSHDERRNLKNSLSDSDQATYKRLSALSNNNLFTAANALSEIGAYLAKSDDEYDHSIALAATALSHQMIQEGREYQKAESEILFGSPTLKFSTGEILAKEIPTLEEAGESMGEFSQFSDEEKEKMIEELYNLSPQYSGNEIEVQERIDQLFEQRALMMKRYAAQIERIVRLMEKPEAHFRQ